MTACSNLLGLVFGHLTVESRAENDRRGQSRWLCKCECGGSSIAKSGDLKTGRTKSCGCGVGNSARTRFRKHGLSGSKEHMIWIAMRARCNNPKDKRYADYGGRGISVCSAWDSFERFMADMGPRPSDDHSIDRTNNDGNYEPTNCRWATDGEQRANKRKRRYWKKPEAICRLQAAE